MIVLDAFEDHVFWLEERSKRWYVLFSITYHLSEWRYVLLKFMARKLYKVKLKVKIWLISHIPDPK